MTIEVAMPVYRPSDRLESVLMALAVQTYKDFYITIYNDTRPEDTEEIQKDQEIIDKMQEQYGLSIQHICNPHNLGYMKNMHKIFDNATGDILFLLADDDILTRDYMELVKDAFSHAEVGVVSRPYYWFIDDMKRPVRYEGVVTEKIHYVDFTKSKASAVKHCISAAGQLTGLAFRRSYLEGMPFVEDMFTAHVYPFLYVFKDHKCAYMPHSMVAVSINSSQTHNDIYSPSPIGQWMDLYNSVVTEKDKASRREEIKDLYLQEYEGLAQIKNYGTYKELFTEIHNFLRFRKANRVSPRFWMYAVGSVIIPRKVLIFLVDYYKNHVLSKKLVRKDLDFSQFPFEECEPLWKYAEYGDGRK